MLFHVIMFNDEIPDGLDENSRAKGTGAEVKVKPFPGIFRGRCRLNQSGGKGFLLQNIGKSAYQNQKRANWYSTEKRFVLYL